MSGLDNVSEFYPPDLTDTKRKVPVDQYALEVEIIGHTAAKERKRKKQILTWPECLDLLPVEEKLSLIRDTLVRAARLDTEKSATKED